MHIFSSVVYTEYRNFESGSYLNYVSKKVLLTTHKCIFHSKTFNHILDQYTILKVKKNVMLIAKVIKSINL